MTQMTDAAGSIVSTQYDGKRRRLYPYKCKGCEEVFLAPKHVNRRYCCNGCSKISRKEAQVPVVCARCGKDFIKKPSSMKNSKSGYRFCSRACKDEGQRIGSALQGMRPKHYSDGRSSYRVIAKRGLPLECNRCKWKTVPAVLKVHHKDRNRKNNSLVNLEILCPNCHDIEHFMMGDGVYTGSRGRRNKIAPKGLVAQSGERRTCNAEAVGS